MPPNPKITSSSHIINISVSLDQVILLKPAPCPSAALLHTSLPTLDVESKDQISGVVHRFPSPLYIHSQWMVNLMFWLFGQMANKSVLTSYWEQDIVLGALGDTKEGMHDTVVTSRSSQSCQEAWLPLARQLYMIKSINERPGVWTL